MRYSKMTFSVQSKQNAYVDSAQNNSATNTDVGNHLANRTGGAPYVASDKNADIENVKKQQEAIKQQQIEKAIREVINGTGLSFEEAKNMLASLNKSNESFNSSTVTKALTCLKYAIEDCTFNGKLDKEKLQKVFGCYVFMTMTPDKKHLSCDEARKVMNMSLVQFVSAHNPSLKGKNNLTAEDVKESLKIFVKKNFTRDKLEQLAAAPDEAKNAIKSMFGMLLGNCKSEELNLLFKAFVMLLQDQDMEKYVPELIKGVCEHLKNDNTGKLQKFLNDDLYNILGDLGFNKDTIDKLKQLGLFNSINADNIEELLTGGLNFLKSIQPEELEILIDAVNIISEGGELTPKQIEILNKYKPQLDQLIIVIGKIANNPELLQGHEDLFNQIQKILQENGLDRYIYSNIQSFFEQFSDLFNNCQSKDDLAKILNKLTDNKYSEAIGDTNPDNLYKANTSTTESEFGLPQRTTPEDYMSSLVRRNDYNQIIIDNNKSNEPEFYVLKNKTEKSGNVMDFILTPWKKYQAVKTLTAKDLFEGLTKNDIDIGYILDNYKDLTHSAKLFINKLIEIMSPAEQNFRLDGMPNSEVIDIIKHSKIDPKDLKLSLDFASNKELERIEENKAAASN